jgi:hypothetical protein
MNRRTTTLGCAALALAGCQQGTRTTMDLLRAGDPGVCIAREVEDTFRQLIRPASDAGAAYTISLADTSLEAFDKGVARATCNTALTVDGPNGNVIERTMVDYVVTPSAQNPGTFLVSSSTTSLQRQIQEAIASDEAVRARDEASRQRQEALTALIKPGWLIGRWVEDTQGSQACTDGPYDDYSRGWRYTDGSFVGRWKLEGQGLTIIGPSTTAQLSITDADVDSLIIEGGDGVPHNYRRCAKGEVQMPATPASPSLSNNLQQAEASDNQ